MKYIGLKWYSKKTEYLIFEITLLCSKWNIRIHASTHTSHSTCATVYVFWLNGMPFLWISRKNFANKTCVFIIDMITNSKDAMTTHKSTQFRCKRSSVIYNILIKLCHSDVAWNMAKWMHAKWKLYSSCMHIAHPPISLRSRIKTINGK